FFSDNNERSELQFSSGSEESSFDNRVTNFIDSAYKFAREDIVDAVSKVFEGADQGIDDAIKRVRKVKDTVTQFHDAVWDEDIQPVFDEFNAAFDFLSGGNS
ncbi:MAG: hypothetical protein KDK65_02350, partial [Chlamydiia bacterium]|nr:hypothetical protein [Chlamydiia bacterium]